MPEIKIKHVVSFSSEDKVHKAENLLKDETYRKWKCATAGEKNATIVLQFEKATKIHSIDIGNEGSAFVEVLVGRSSDSVNNYQVLLVASSFMSPLESRNGTHTNRVRMFGPEKLSQSTKEEKWDCVQIVCTQPFNKNMQYGLTFIKFHSPPEKIEEQSEKSVTNIGSFKLKNIEDDDEDTVPFASVWFGKQKTKASENSSGSAADQDSPSYAAAVLATKAQSEDNSLKRKAADKDASQEPPSKRIPLNKNHIVYKDVLRDSPESKKAPDTNKNLKRDVPSPKVKEKRKEPPSNATPRNQNANNTPTRRTRQKVPFNKIMDRVVFVLSGFVNPLRSDLRDKALEMGAKYKPDWDPTCTHLVCAFAKTPKFEQVKKENGRIVTKEWIFDCYRKKEPLLWRKYALDGDSSDENDDSDNDPNYVNNNDDDEEEEEVSTDGFIVEDSDEEDYSTKKKKKQKTRFQRNREARSPNKKKPQSPVKNQTAASNNNTHSSNTPTRKLLKISDSEDESTTPKKVGDSSISHKLKNVKQQTASDNTRKKLNLSDSEDESSTTPKKMGESSILNKNVRQQTALDNTQSPAAQKTNGESETEDEDALQDYIADTDAEVDSDGDTEDELRKFEEKIQKKKFLMNGTNKEEQLSEKPDVSDLPLPDLPDFFKKRRFYLYGDFLPTMMHELQRYITAYNGVIEDYMSDRVKYVITEKQWDKTFDEALNSNDDLIFVKPTWIYNCHKTGKLVPYQPYIVIPDI